MRSFMLLSCLLLAACEQGASAPSADHGNDAAAPPQSPLRPASPKPQAADGEWQGERGDLQFVDSEKGTATMMLACHGGTLSVRLPGVRPIGSEERLSFGGGGDLETLVADSRSTGPAVEARGPAPGPAALAALMSGGPGASYGATAVGPLVPVPQTMIADFVKACGQPGGT